MRLETFKELNQHKQGFIIRKKVSIADMLSWTKVGVNCCSATQLGHYNDTIYATLATQSEFLETQYLPVITTLFLPLIATQSEIL